MSVTRERLRAEAHNAMMIVARGMALPLRDRLRTLHRHPARRRTPDPAA